MDSTQITQDTTVRRLERVLSSSIDNETVMLDLEKGLYYGLNPVASHIWGLLEKPISVRQICEQLAAQYDDVAAGMCEDDVIRFLRRLLEQGIVETAGPAHDVRSSG